MKKFVKIAAGRAFAGTGLLRRQMGEAGLIVAFHKVNDENDDGLTCSVADFERYCQFFSSCFDTISLNEFVTRLEKGRSIAGALAITFDDGYRDNFVHAAPVLKALDLPATFFIVSRFMSTDHTAWWDRELDPKPPWMTWEEVQGLADMGFNIGAHTQNHIDLGEVASEVAQAEIIGSKADLESRLGKPIDLFAYPYGGVENLLEDNRSKVHAAGFRCCASCFGGLVQPGDDPFRLNRVAISNWFESPEQLAFEIATHRV